MYHHSGFLRLSCSALGCRTAGASRGSLRPALKLYSRNTTFPVWLTHPTLTRDTYSAMASVLQEHIHLRFTRFSAFYTPLLLTLKSKDLKGSGIKLTYDRATPALSVDAGLADGSVHVAQSAPALSFKSALSGQPPAYRHFALMNNRDGFFLAARKGSTAAVQQPQPGSTAAVQGPAPGTWQWGNLEGSTALIDHFFQPLALFRIALRCQGVDESRINIIDAGSPDAIEAAFRAGKGDVLHMQGPAPQQLELEGLCTVVASVGEAAVPLAFSSLCAKPEWLQSPVAPLFMSSFVEARATAAAAPPADLAAQVASFLPEFSQEAIVRTIAAYQSMGTWQGSAVIDADLYQRTAQVFTDVGYIAEVPPMDLVVAAPPIATS